MKYFVLAGEASGDKQAALLCEALYARDPEAQISGWGGESMMEKGVHITRHYRELAYMGFVEVVKHLPAIMRNFKKCKSQILQLAPDALILVDYPGFNLRMAAWAYQQRIPVYYYISPQLWAWHTSRVHKIKKAVRKMYVILPFEQEFYKQYGMDVMYIGHPLAAEIRQDSQFRYSPQKGHIALLPGSRQHEIDRLLPEMAGLARLMPDFTFHVVAVPHLSMAVYEHHLSGLTNVKIETGRMKETLAMSEAAVVTSGTATLETALFGVPQVVVYKGSPLSYMIARRLVKVEFISLVNLIIGKALVPELIQSDCRSDKIFEKLKEILVPSHAKNIMKDYQMISDLLTAGGGAQRAARDIIADLSKGVN